MKSWWQNLSGRVKFREALARHTTFRIGGAARMFFQPRDPQELKSLLKGAKDDKLPVLVIGAGSNLLVSDYGVRAAVVKLNAPYFKTICFKKSRVEVASGVPLSKLIVQAERRGLGGLEALAGIPGTLGGALAMNAGISLKVKSKKAKGKSIGDLVAEVTVMDRGGKTKVLKKKDIVFGYRHSSLAKYIILIAHLNLKKKNKKEIGKDISDYLAYRKLTQDYSLPSAGCVFKNPQTFSAGMLIDRCGLKGKKRGQAVISRKHANFILNRGKARASDVLWLMDLARKKVKDKFRVELEPEIKIWR